MYRCETCGADFEAPMILDGSDQYFNALDEEGEAE